MTPDIVRLARQSISIFPMAKVKGFTPPSTSDLSFFRRRQNTKYDSKGGESKSSTDEILTKAFLDNRSYTFVYIFGGVCAYRRLLGNVQNIIYGRGSPFAVDGRRVFASQRIRIADSSHTSRRWRSQETMLLRSRLCGLRKLAKLHTELSRNHI